jgi:hypothetical protein
MAWSRARSPRRINRPRTDPSHRTSGTWQRTPPTSVSLLVGLILGDAALLAWVDRHDALGRFAAKDKEIETRRDRQRQRDQRLAHDRTLVPRPGELRSAARLPCRRNAPCARAVS